MASHSTDSKTLEAAEAAGGIPVKWVVAEPEGALAFQQLLKKDFPEIEVVFIPPE
jgi:hypothetical protein